MKNIKPFGPTIGITKIKKSLIKKLNNEFDLKSTSKKKDYSSKLASQIQNEVLFSKGFIKSCSKPMPCLKTISEAKSPFFPFFFDILCSLNLSTTFFDVSPIYTNLVQFTSTDLFSCLKFLKLHASEPSSMM